VWSSPVCDLPTPDAALALQRTAPYLGKRGNNINLSSFEHRSATKDSATTNMATDNHRRMASLLFQPTVPYCAVLRQVTHVRPQLRARRATRYTSSNGSDPLSQAKGSYRLNPRDTRIAL
jgi:hypothetical protein